MRGVYRCPRRSDVSTLDVCSVISPNIVGYARWYRCYNAYGLVYQVLAPGVTYTVGHVLLDQTRIELARHSCLSPEVEVRSDHQYSEPRWTRLITYLLAVATLCFSSNHLNTSLLPSNTASTSFAILVSLGTPPFLPFSAAFKIQTIPCRVR
jgi:hypothetical protein